MTGSFFAPYNESGGQNKAPTHALSLFKPCNSGGSLHCSKMVIIRLSSKLLIVAFTMLYDMGPTSF